MNFTRWGIVIFLNYYHYFAHSLWRKFQIFYKKKKEIRSIDVNDNIEPDMSRNGKKERDEDAGAVGE